jgi:surface antigen
MIYSVATIVGSLLLSASSASASLFPPVAPASVAGIENPKAFLWTNELMGEYNLTACSGALSCGSNMASYDGVNAKSNGYDQCTGNCCGGHISTGCAYQCVELAQRWMNVKHGITPIWYVNANQMCDSHPSGVKKTSNPQPGDLWVRTTGTYGHVAVITAVHSSTVDVIEQNSSPTGRNTYNKADAGCFLTAGSSSSGCHTKGYYCGALTSFDASYSLMISLV